VSKPFIRKNRHAFDGRWEVWDDGFLYGSYLCWEHALWAVLYDFPRGRRSDTGRHLLDIACKRERGEVW
jgi:hypothetical protein